MNTPDIEIYVKNLDVNLISDWLSDFFKSANLRIDGDSLSKGITVQYDVKPVQDETINIPLIITPNAAGKAFTSLWFKSDKTGWVNDKSAANSLISFLSHNKAKYEKTYDLIEIRCSATGWKENIEDDEEWWKISAKETRLINW